MWPKVISIIFKMNVSKEKNLVIIINCWEIDINLVHGVFSLRFHQENGHR